MRCTAALLAVCAVFTTASCTPNGAAVGDTQDHQPAIAHAGIQRADMLISLIGSTDVDRDRLVLTAFATAKLHASYVSTSQVSDPVTAAQQGVIDMTNQQVHVIIISGIDVTDNTADSWAQTLEAPREAGIPVVLLEPQTAPQNTQLYAAVFTINDRATDATPIDQAIDAVINDEPHERDMMVTTNVA
ncbi:sugar ABC transporter substrate-binding protein [Bifidobacterium goeldii]|nr:sugar ABC transporter substrate-binding protein [Bifidobacterium goeldii]